MKKIISQQDLIKAKLLAGDNVPCWYNTRESFTNWEQTEPFGFMTVCWADDLASGDELSEQDIDSFLNSEQAFLPMLSDSSAMLNKQDQYIYDLGFEIIAYNGADPDEVDDELNKMFELKIPVIQVLEYLKLKNIEFI